MTVSGVRATSVSATTLEPETPLSSSPKKPTYQPMATPPPLHENQAITKPPPASRPVVASQHSRGSSLSSAENAGDIIGDYALGETIGKGTFGKVKLGLHLLTGEKVAVKILEKKRIVEVADVERVAREIQILKRNRHVNVIQLFEVIDSPARIFLIMEFVDGGEMFEYIVAHHRIREPEAVVLFQQIVDGLDYLHTNEVTHRDLKPENLLLQSCAGMPTGQLVKIVDFGLSNTHDGGRLLRTACGSPCYAAPEMIQGKLYRGPVADLWSLGVVLFAMVCGYLPFEDSNTNLLYKKILTADYKMPPFLSHAVQDLLRRIFETNPEKRITIEMIRQHPWFTSTRPTVPKAVAMATTYDDPRLRQHILSQLAAVGLDPTDVEDALTRKVHNHLTAAFYLLYNKLLRVMKNQASSSHNQQQTRPQPPLQHPQPPVSSSKSDGTPRRPETTAVPEEGHCTTVCSKETIPVKAPSSTAANVNESAVSHQRRRTSNEIGASSMMQVTRTPSQHSAAQPSPRHHATPTPATTVVATQGPHVSVRRPSAVRSGRNLVLLTNGTLSPAGTTASTLSTTMPRPQIPARPPSQGSNGQTQGTRISISNGMVALTPLSGQKRPDSSTSGRRQTIVSSTALTTTASGSHALVRRRLTTALPASTALASPADTATIVSHPPTAQTPHAPLMPRLSARKEDAARTVATTESQQRIPPQRPQATPPASAPASTAQQLTPVL